MEAVRERVSEGEPRGEAVRSEEESQGGGR